MEVNGKLTVGLDVGHRFTESCGRLTRWRKCKRCTRTTLLRMSPAVQLSSTWTGAMRRVTGSAMPCQVGAVGSPPRRPNPW